MAEEVLRERVAAAIQRIGLVKTAQLLEVGANAAARLAAGAAVHKTTEKLAALNAARLDVEQRAG